MKNDNPISAASTRTNPDRQTNHDMTAEYNLASRYPLRQEHREIAFEAISWKDAVGNFLRQPLSAKEQKTQAYYRLNLERLTR